MPPASLQNGLQRERPPALFVDSDTEFLKSIQSDSLKSDYPAVCAPSTEEARKYIENFDQPVSAVFVNPEGCDNQGLNIVRLVHLHRPATPVYLIYNSVRSPFSSVELQHLAIHKALEKKKVSFETLMELLAPINVGMHLLQEHDPEFRIKHRSTAMLSEVDREFFPVRLDQFFSGSPSFFDIYVRISTNHYVKVLKKGESFSPQNLRKYVYQGVAFFYVQTKTQEEFLNYCEQKVEDALQNPDISLIDKTAQIADLGEQTMKFLRQNGVSEEQMERAHRYVKSVETLASQIKQLNDSAYYKRFMKNIGMYEHGVANAMITSMICTSIGMDKDLATNVVGMGALLHDIGLFHTLPPEHLDEDESKMDPEERRLYRAHPLVGAQILKNIGGVDEKVIGIVAQHHERRNSKGFPPKKIGQSHDNILAEIVGVSDEFVRLIQQSQSDPRIIPFEIMEQEILSGFSKSVRKAFEEFFFMTLL